MVVRVSGRQLRLLRRRLRRLSALLRLGALLCRPLLEARELPRLVTVKVGVKIEC